jgi:hypothetical protein
MSLTTRLARAAASKTRGLPAWSRVSGVTAGNVGGAASTTASRTMFSAASPVTAAAGGLQLKELATANPYKDVVRYEHKNRKWNLQHVDYYSEALAVGLLETGLQPGDVVLSWLPGHLSESVSEDQLIGYVCLLGLSGSQRAASVFNLSLRFDTCSFRA